MASRAKRRHDLMARLWPLGHLLNRAGRLPLLSSWLQPWFGSEGNEAIIIPIQEAVRGTESVVLPYPLLTALVERASACCILHDCLCRSGEKCRAFPREPGCLFLGDGAAQIDPTLGRQVGREDAMAHALRAMELGLVPMVVHSSFDAWVLDIPYQRMLAICFCCDCCCTVRKSLRQGPPAFQETVIRLPGLHIEVGPECTGCGLCAEACAAGAISVDQGTARIGSACKGCGTCAALCPTGAIRLHIDDEGQMLDRLLARIEQRTNIGIGQV